MNIYPEVANNAILMVITDILLPNRGAADDIRCLEIFARYLLPNYTSIGLEVYKLQNTNLFEITKEEIV